jgi:hypothetical protein
MVGVLFYEGRAETQCFQYFQQSGDDKQHDAKADELICDLDIICALDKSVAAIKALEHPVDDRRKGNNHQGNRKPYKGKPQNNPCNVQTHSEDRRQ